MSTFDPTPERFDSVGDGYAHLCSNRAGVPFATMQRTIRLCRAAAGLAREVAELRELLARRRVAESGQTHSEECWRLHFDCAQARLAEQDAELAELRKRVAAIAQQKQEVET